MKSNKGITLISLVVTIVVLIILALVSISLIMYDEQLNGTNTVNQEVKQKQEVCEHDWVTTSKWDIFKGCYRTISKCSKCGKEID